MYHLQRALKVPRSHPYKYIDPYFYPEEEERNRSNCCAKLFGHVVQFIIAVIFFIGVIVLFLWLFFRPYPVNVYVEAAQLNRFQMFKTMPPYINYNLTAVVSMQNPNKFIGIYYDWLELDSFYQDARFDWTALPTFYQEPTNSTVLKSDVGGGTYFWLRSNGVEDYLKEENTTGIYSVNLWLYGDVRYRFKWVNTRKRQLSVKCPVKLSVTVPGMPAAFFNRTSCNIVRYWTKA
ncbi:protein YLS9-like protein [Carex littledalei]|uniref:Protein YLS9-like protein n=1 Tax=Carex littledalei TaxID=544730 RepID=A0A833R0X6_9POAL|nr:protein YLS9-like protein [Carex littledalei]